MDKVGNIFTIMQIDLIQTKQLIQTTTLSKGSLDEMHSMTQVLTMETAPIWKILTVLSPIKNKGELYHKNGQQANNLVAWVKWDLKLMKMRRM